MVRGQCTKILMDKMNHNLNWGASNTIYDPLKFMTLIETTIMYQTEDQ